MESFVFELVLGLLVTGVTLAVVLAAGGIFLQGYFYTEVGGALWQAPVTAAIMTLFLFVWCWLDIRDSRSRPGYVPYDTLLQFNPDVNLTPEPIKQFETKRKGSDKLQVYEAYKIPQGAGPARTQYFERGQTGAKGPKWTDSGVEALLVEHDGRKIEFKPQRGDGSFNYYVSPEGWTMIQYDTGVTGVARMFSWWLLIANLFLNFFHLALWFACLWLVLRFQWAHAFGLALALWAVVTLFVLPVLLARAATLAGP